MNDLDTRAQWLKDRRTGIGGTDIPAILGISPWRSAVDVYLDKTGQGTPVADSEPMYWGRALEGIVAEEFGRRTSLRVRVPSQQIYRHPVHEWAVGSIDREVSREVLGSVEGVLECKTASAYEAPKWHGEDGSDAMPVHYAAQGMWYLAVTSLEVCHFAALIGGQSFVIRKVERDEDTIRGLLEQASEFWHRHVLAGVPPEPRTGDEAYRLWRRDSGEMRAIDNDTEALVAFNEYRALREQAQQAEDRAERAADALRLLCGEHAGLSIGGVPVLTWKASKDTPVTDWRAVAQAMNPSAELVAAHTTTKPGSRRLLLKG